MESLRVKSVPSGIPAENRLVSLLLLILRGSGTSGLGDTSCDLKPNSLMKSSMASMMRFVVFCAMLSLRGGGAGAW